MIGTELPRAWYPVSRADLVRYAAASGDFNPIHWSQSAAGNAGLPDVVAHGMLTAGLMTRTVISWTGRPDAVLSSVVRFVKPVAVPDVSGTVIVVDGRVTAIEAGDLATVELVARCDGQQVARMTATVLVPSPPCRRTATPAPSTDH
jgi:acyl dehydratase